MTDRIEAAGYNWQVAAENLAAGPSTAERTVKGWIKSPPHRVNMLTAEAVHAGIAHVFSKDDPGDFRYHHYWVLLVAAPQAD